MLRLSAVKVMAFVPEAAEFFICHNKNFICHNKNDDDK